MPRDLTSSCGRVLLPTTHSLAHKVKDGRAWREPFLQGAEQWTGLARSGNKDRPSVTGVRGTWRKWQGRRPVVKCPECQAEVLGRCPTGRGRRRDLKAEGGDSVSWL